MIQPREHIVFWQKKQKNIGEKSRPLIAVPA